MDDPRARYECPKVEQVVRLLVICNPRVLLPLFPCDWAAGFGETQKGADEDDDQGDEAGVVVLRWLWILFHEYR